LSRPVVAVADYGAGNTFSMCTALERIGASAHVVKDGGALESGTSHLVLPGVGAFGHCMTQLRASGLAQRVSEWIAAGRPLLGVCIGLQLLCSTSDESPGVTGLGVLSANVERLVAPGERIPHVGWNTVRDGGPSGPPARGSFYFNHSFGLREHDLLTDVRWCDHGGGFVAEGHIDSVTVAQFHPEKSQAAGEQLLRRFLEKNT